MPTKDTRFVATQQVGTAATITTSSSQKGKDDNDPKELKAAAARGLKTKIRRLYDIANVFLSVGLLKKVDSNDSSRRPNFAWSYRLSAKALYDLHRPSNNETNNTTATPPPPPPQEESSPALASCASFVAPSTNLSTTQQAQPVVEETCA
jgi:hypothetical protein